MFVMYNLESIWADCMYMSYIDGGFFERLTFIQAQQGRMKTSRRHNKSGMTL